MPFIPNDGSFLDSFAKRRRAAAAAAAQASSSSSSSSKPYSALGPGSRGRRLLSKMGWTQGQGLGKHEQGPTSPIKRKMQADRKGLGFSFSSSRKKRRRRGSGFTSTPVPPSQTKARHWNPSSSNSSSSRSSSSSNNNSNSNGPSDSDGSISIEGPVVLRRGSQVRVCGLASEKGKRKNGRAAFIDRYDTAKERYVVNMDDGSTLSIKSGNLCQILGNISVCGLKSQPELNGAAGSIVDFDSEKNRYVVQLKGSGRVLSLRPPCVRLPRRTAVRLVGLVKASATRHNNRWGRILSFDAASGRYVVGIWSKGDLGGKNSTSSASRASAASPSSSSSSSSSSSAEHTRRRRRGGATPRDEDCGEEQKVEEDKEEPSAAGRGECGGGGGAVLQLKVKPENVRI